MHLFGRFASVERRFAAGGGLDFLRQGLKRPPGRSGKGECGFCRGPHSPLAGDWRISPGFMNAEWFVSIRGHNPRVVEHAEDDHSIRPQDEENAIGKTIRQNSPHIGTAAKALEGIRVCGGAIELTWTCSINSLPSPDC
jgi:hypothetical protein